MDRVLEAEAEVEKLREIVADYQKSDDALKNELREIALALNDVRTHNTMTMAEVCRSNKAEIDGLRYMLLKALPFISVQGFYEEARSLLFDKAG